MTKCNNNPCFCHGDYRCDRPLDSAGTTEQPEAWFYFAAFISVAGYIMVACLAFIGVSLLLAAFTNFYPATSCAVLHLVHLCQPV